MSDRSVFVDIETTGLDPEKDDILEISVIEIESINDLDHEYMYTNVDILLTGDISKMNEYVYKMHTESGLIEELIKTKGSRRSLSLEEADDLLYANFSTYKGPMGGNSVHFDRAFIKNKLPKFHSCFNYRNIDVSTLQQLVRMIHGFNVLPPPSEKPHRAYTDVCNSANILGQILRSGLLKLESK